MFRFWVRGNCCFSCCFRCSKIFGVDYLLLAFAGAGAGAGAGKIAGASEILCADAGSGTEDLGADAGSGKNASAGGQF